MLHIQVCCPNCSRSGDVPEAYVGKQIRCKACGSDFEAKAVAPRWFVKRKGSRKEGPFTPKQLTTVAVAPGMRFRREDTTVWIPLPANGTLPPQLPKHVFEGLLEVAQGRKAQRLAAAKDHDVSGLISTLNAIVSASAMAGNSRTEVMDAAAHALMCLSESSDDREAEQAVQEARRVLAAAEARQVLAERARWAVQKPATTTPYEAPHGRVQTEEERLDAAGGRGYVPGVAYDI